MMQRQRRLRRRMVRLQRCGILLDPARRDGGGQRRLQGFGRDVGRTLEKRGLIVDRGRGGVLKRGHARFVSGEGYLARDGIKYLRRLDGFGFGTGPDAGGEGKGAQPQAGSCKV